MKNVLTILFLLPCFLQAQNVSYGMKALTQTTTGTSMGPMGKQADIKIITNQTQRLRMLLISKCGIDTLLTNGKLVSDSLIIELLKRGDTLRTAYIKADTLYSK